jgi:hypothetical protein
MNKKEEQKIEEAPEVVEAAKHVNIHVNATDNLKELIEKNIKWSQVIYEQNRKIKHRLTLMVIGDYLKLLIIVVPIILALIYLPPLLKGALNQYSSLLGIGGGGVNQVNDILSQVSGGQLDEILQNLGLK